MVRLARIMFLMLDDYSGVWRLELSTRKDTQYVGVLHPISQARPSHVYTEYSEHCNFGIVITVL